MTCARTQPRLRPAFSLVELVVAVVIIGIIAAIAVPRMSSAAARARVNSLRGDLAVLNRAVEFYAAEHCGRHPGQDASGSPLTDGDDLAVRLIGRTNERGNPGTSFGPYLLRVPANPFNGLATIRIDGAPAGAGTHGWHYASATRSFAPDDSVATAAIAADSVGIAALEKDGKGGAEALGAAAAMAEDDEK